MKISSGGCRSRAAMISCGSRHDQGMVAIGLIAEQVVDEKMACRAVQSRVEMQRALPAPDVKPRIVPERRHGGRSRGPCRARQPTAAPPCTERSALEAARAGSRAPGGTRSLRCRLSERKSRRPPARSVVDRCRFSGLKRPGCCLGDPNRRPRAEIASAQQTATVMAVPAIGKR